MLRALAARGVEVEAVSGTSIGALVAVCFATITLMNAFNQRIFLKIPLDKKVLLGSVFGLIGIGFVFWREIGHFHFGDSVLRGVLISLAAALKS